MIIACAVTDCYHNDDKTCSKDEYLKVSEDGECLDFVPDPTQK